MIEICRFEQGEIIHEKIKKKQIVTIKSAPVNVEELPLDRLHQLSPRQYVVSGSIGATYLVVVQRF